MVSPEAGAGQSPRPLTPSGQGIMRKNHRDHSFPMTTNPSRTAKAAIVSGSCFLNPRPVGGSLSFLSIRRDQCHPGPLPGQKWQLEALSMGPRTQSIIVEPVAIPQCREKLRLTEGKEGTVKE